MKNAAKPGRCACHFSCHLQRRTINRRSKYGMRVNLPAAVTAAHFSQVRPGAPCSVLVRMVAGSFTAVDAQGELLTVTQSLTGPPEGLGFRVHCPGHTVHNTVHHHQCSEHVTWQTCQWLAAHRLQQTISSSGGGAIFNSGELF